MAVKQGYSPRKIGSIIDTAHIVIGIAVIIMAVFAIFKPVKYMFLFPVIFFLASALSFFNFWFLMVTNNRSQRRKIAGVVYAVIGTALFALFVISAISIWLNG